MFLHRFTAAVLVYFFMAGVCAQGTPQDSLKKTPAPQSHSNAKWYDKIGLRGYAQFRYNRLAESNPNLQCDQCDKGIGKNQGFEFRRARLVFSGNPHDRLFLYIQFDYSSDASSTSKHFLQLRDAYFDYAFDKKKTYRLRFGQSKVPFGFENMQSSSNRLPFDRVDALNSGVPNERDFGAFFLFTPEKRLTLLKRLVDEGLKGAGDYGVFALGLYNGQVTNKPELNNNQHVVARLSYPFQIGNQIVESGIQAYSGKFTLAKDQISAGVKIRENPTFTDRRIAFSFVLFPQPFGIQAEYNIGESPAFDPATDSIRVQKLQGGYVTASFRTKVKSFYLTPYVRYQVYDGGKKHETDARNYDLNETEIGLEWQVFKNLELTLAYAISNRKYDDFKTAYDEKGRLLRLQIQVNY
ncbi:MAG: porin [Lewinellaceae bacterium]|nr:porin [Lewinellaceae bacterium]